MDLSRLFGSIAVGALGCLQMLFWIIGATIILICGIRLIIEAFRSGILWGIAVICIHPLIIVYVLLHWRNSGRLFLSSLAGAGLIIIGGIISTYNPIMLHR
jgi:hypothetical protein